MGGGARTVTAPAQPTVRDLFVQVMRAVDKIEKTGRNTDQNYNFRGIDAVMNTVGPIVREAGLIVLPAAVEVVAEERYETKRGAAMRSVTVRTTWLITGPAGDTMTAQSLGEAADSGDKAVAKAQSVAARVLWLQGLWVPTGDPDVDANSHERSARPAADRPQATQGPVDQRPVLRAEIAKVGRAMGSTIEQLGEAFAANNAGVMITDGTVNQLHDFLNGLRQEAAQQQAASA